MYQTEILFLRAITYAVFGFPVETKMSTLAHTRWLILNE